MAWKALLVFCLCARAAAFPSSLGSGGCRSWAAGQPGYMSSGTLVDGATVNNGNPNCEVSVTGELSPSQQYTVTVAAAVDSLTKLYSSDGQCLNPNEAHSSPANRAGSQTFTWTSPASIDDAGIMLYAVCSASFSATMYAAAPVQLCPAGGCVDPTTMAAEESTTMGPQIAMVNDVQLAEGMFLSFKPATINMEEGIEITVTFNNAVWIGFGFSAGDEISMVGNGAGAELFVCTNGEVRRYFVTTKTINEQGEAVSEGSCTQESGSATMTFKRSLAGSSGDGRRLTAHAVAPGSFQQVIWAYDNGADAELGYHGNVNRGGLFIDFATGESPTEPPATTPVAGGQSSVATVTDLELTSGMLLSFNPTDMDGSEGISITVTFNDDVYIGFGFSAGSGVSMTGNGAGADIYVCTNGDVRRHPSVTTKTISGNGEAVTDSSCSQENGGTTMTFKRSLDGGRRLAQAITPGSQQQVIWAYDQGSSKAVGYHGTGNRGGIFIDFATGSTGEAFLEGQAPLYIHLVMMILAWGFFLPSGVALAACLRRAPNGTAGGVWFSFHWKFQALGFVLMIVGLVAAIWYAEEYSTHFDGGHTVLGLVICILAGLQVLGGALRPHKDDPPSTARVVFEKLHKGLGYSAVIMGAINVIIGVWLVHDLDFESAVKTLSIALTVIFMLPVVIFVAVSAVMPDNPLSKALLGKANPSTDGEAATTIGNSSS